MKYLINTIKHIKLKQIKMKPIDVKTNAYTDIDDESNDKDPKFKISDHVRISTFKHIFSKGYTPNSLEVFVLKK